MNATYSWTFVVVSLVCYLCKWCTWRLFWAQHFEWSYEGIHWRSLVAWAYLKPSTKANQEANFFEYIIILGIFMFNYSCSWIWSYIYLFYYNCSSNMSEIFIVNYKYFGSCQGSKVILKQLQHGHSHKCPITRRKLVHFNRPCD